jgi:hypothetical protein
MQGLVPTPTKEAEASIVTKNVRDGPNESLKGTFKIPRNAKKRTLPWDLEAGKRKRLSPAPHDEDIRAKKKPRLEERFSASTSEATTKIPSLDTTEALPPPVDDAAPRHAVANHPDSDPVMDMHLNARATGARRRWTTDEDTRLKKAVLVHTHDGKTHNWDAIAALVPGRTLSQCKGRWYDALHPRIVRTTARTDKWTPNEDDTLKEAVQMHNSKDWFSIATLVPGRTKKQCRNRWHGTLNPSIDWAPVLKGEWTPAEDEKLKDAVQMHNGKNWEAIATLVPGRTKGSVITDGMMPWIPVFTGRLGVRVNGHQTKTLS